MPSVKIDGVWKNMDSMWVNIDGVWKVVSGASVKVDGVWKDVLGFTPPAPNQVWASHPDSPVLTADYPYQLIAMAGTQTWLLCGTAPIFAQFGTNWTSLEPFNCYFYRSYETPNWTNNGNPYSSGIATNLGELTGVEANEDVYTDITLTTVLFAKTT